MTNCCQWGKEDKKDDAPIFCTNASTGESGQDEYGTKVFGIETTEAQVMHGLSSAGWVRTVTGTGGRANRTVHEVLVASRTLIEPANPPAPDDDEGEDPTPYGFGVR